MELPKEVIEEFVTRIKSDEFFKEAYDITQRNSSGKIWLIGGSEYTKHLLKNPIMIL